MMKKKMQFCLETDLQAHTKCRGYVLRRVLISALVISTIVCLFCIGVSASETQSSNYSGVLTSFIELLVGGISSLAEGIGSGVNGFVQDLFISADGNGLSTFGAVIAIFGGIALAISVTTLVFNWIRSIGN